MPVVLFFLSASNNFVSAEDHVHLVHYRISDSNVDEYWMDNLNRIKELQKLLENNTPSKINIFAAASPDGPYSLNKQLSEDRASSTVSLIKRLCPTVSDTVFVTKTLSEDIEGTINLILKSGQPWAEEAVSLLRKGGQDPEEELRHFKGGKVWRYLADNVYPQLRRSEITIVCNSKESTTGLAAGVAPSDNADNQAVTTVAQDGVSPASKDSGKVPGWALGTMAVLAAAVAGFGFLYARERRRTRSLLNDKIKPTEPVAAPTAAEEPVLPPSEPEEPVIEAPEPIAPSPDVVEPVAAAPEAVEPVPVEPAGPTFLDKVKDKIQENIADSNFGVEELAVAMGMSRIHLNRKLKSEADASPSALLKEARMDLAARLLKEGRMSISEVSSMSGFSTPSYFATAFKDYYNISPSDYIAQN
ncbi:MAG: helix-turn-helix domain-containing protein [Bacteroidales bacterium]|nr:helix-turn-helix domain-containing protein [Bacteroidales bacterium]